MDPRGNQFKPGPRVGQPTGSRQSSDTGSRTNESSTASSDDSEWDSEAKSGGGGAGCKGSNRAATSLNRRTSKVNADPLSVHKRHTATDSQPDADEEGERKRVRRERNKQAAARCRQRRVDLTNTLVAETESLDQKRANLQREVESLMQEKSRLEFILEVHASRCRIQPGGYTGVKVESQGDWARSHLSPHRQPAPSVQPAPAAIRPMTPISRPSTVPTNANFPTAFPTPFSPMFDHNSSMMTMTSTTASLAMSPMTSTTSMLPTSSVELMSPMTSCFDNDSFLGMPNSYDMKREGPTQEWTGFNPAGFASGFNPAGLASRTAAATGSSNAEGSSSTLFRL